MLTRVRFQGIKVLGDVTTELRPFTVIVGPNGCGKSTLLDQIALLCLASQPGPSANSYVGVNLALGDPARRASIGPTIGATSPARWVGEAGEDRRLEIEVGGLGEVWGARKAEAHLSGIAYDVGPASGAEGESVLRARFAWKCQRIRPVADPLTEPELFKILQNLAFSDPEAFLALQADLRRVIPVFSCFHLVIEAVEGPRGEGSERPTSLWMVLESGGKVPLGAASDGTRVAITLLAAIYNPKSPSLVLIDDIDNGLHLSAQSEVIAAIRRVMARRPELQVVCTTHSPVLLDSFSPEEVRVMALGPDGLARIQPLSAHPPVDGYRSGVSSGELWANLGEDWVAAAQA